jgi:AAA+ superfamily predicted ATPase
MLQEVEYWPDTGLLLAATNHPELIDPALWRRFDLLVEFDMPDATLVKDAIIRFLDKDFAPFEKWIEILVHAFIGDSYSDIERTLQRFRRALALNMANDKQLVEDFIMYKTLELDRQAKKELAILMTEKTTLSQHAISHITGVSRDTIRKHAGNKKDSNGG